MPIYGIDLGTTNSLIGCNNKLLYTAPSVVNTTTGRAGKLEFDNPEAVRNYKVDMQMSDYGLVAVHCSKCVLEELKMGAGLTKEEPIEAVISVPAYFNGGQCEATIKAAKLANINVRSLIKEPTAAALYINKDKDGISAIFDLGGGTFDIAIIKSQGGKHQVVATDGCILGGRDLDAALGSMLVHKYQLGLGVAEDIGFRHSVVEGKMFRGQGINAFTPCKVKVPSFSPSGLKEVELDIMDYATTVYATFKKSLILTKNVFKEAGIDPKTVNFCFVGGSTHCDFIRSYVETGLGVKAVPDTYDRDDVVAKGAIYYASLVEAGTNTEVMNDTSKQVSFILDNAVVATPILYKNSSLPATASLFDILANRSGSIKQTYNIKVLYGDSIFAPAEITGGGIESNNVIVCDFDFTFSNEVKEAVDTAVTLTVQLSEEGKLTFSVEEPLEAAKIIEKEITL